MATLSNQNFASAKPVSEHNEIDAQEDVPRFQTLKNAPSHHRKAKGGELIDIPSKFSPKINDSNREIDWLLVGTNHFPSAFASMMAAEPFDSADGETIDLLVEDPFLALEHRRSTLAAEKDLNRQALALESAAEHKKRLVHRLHEANEAKKQRKEMVQKAKSLKSSGELDDGKQQPKPMDAIAVGMDGFTVPNFLKEETGDEGAAAATNSSFGKNAGTWIAKAKDSIVAAASTPFKNSSFGSSAQAAKANNDDGIQTLNDVAQHVRKEVIRAHRHEQACYEVIDAFPLRSALVFNVSGIAKHFPNTKNRLHTLHQQWSASENARPIRQSLSELVKGESKSSADAPKYKNNSSEFYYDATSDTLLDKKRMTLAKDGKKGLLSYLPLPMHWEPPRHGESDAARKASANMEEGGRLLEGSRFFTPSNVHLGVLEVQGAQAYGKALLDNVWAFRAHVIATRDANRHLIARHHRNLFLMKRIETTKLRRTNAATNSLAKRIATELKSKEDQAERLIDRKMAVYRRKQFLDKRRATIKESLQKHEARFFNNKKSQDKVLQEQFKMADAKRDKVEAHRLALLRIRVERLAALEALRKKRTAANIEKRNVTSSPVEYW